jgi:hypothetical protein
MGWPRLESELDARPENDDGSSLDRGLKSSPSTSSSPPSSSSSSTTISPSMSISSSSSSRPPALPSGTAGEGGNGICSCSLLSHGSKAGNGYGRSLTDAFFSPSAIDLVNKSLRRCGHAFLSICRTDPARLSAIWALKQVSREHAPASWSRLRSTAEPDCGQDLLDTFESTFGRTDGRTCHRAVRKG